MWARYEIDASAADLGQVQLIKSANTACFYDHGVMRFYTNLKAYAPSYVSLQSFLIYC